ncbi:phage terminase small subunit P27 family [Cupriavidus taiwanensis]|uniref:phage terminase small subunit P27 family n=1 Tax=Cupriavidus taiwanensis TaxID=164546 RepID=UPI000E117044|nr:phage terminase small subunit P27 family [Cupriavidus taiwanensis]SPA17237.1 Phage terminase, small subunit, P27 family [Cupriavidus taiwanensis]
MMQKGVRPKPTALKVIEGDRGHRPLPAKEPKLKAELPTMPKHLDGGARDEWARITTELQHVGLLTQADTAILAMYCQAYSRWQRAERILSAMAERDPSMSAFMIKTTSGNAIQNPMVGVANRAMLLTQRFAAELGFTPAARARVSTAGDDDDPVAKTYF